MSPSKRAIRRVPFLRYCAMRHAQRERKRQRKVRWEYVQSILTTVGNITIAWAGIELMMTHLIVWYHDRGGKAIRPDLPRMLKWQLDYLKKLENNPMFAGPTAIELASIRLEIARLNNIRNTLIHGVLHLTHTINLTWRTHSIKIDGNGWRFVTTHFSNDDLVRASTEISALGHRMSPFIARVIGMPHPADPT